MMVMRRLLNLMSMATLPYLKMRGGWDWMFSVTVFLTCCGFISADIRPPQDSSSSLLHKALGAEAAPHSSSAYSARLKRAPWAPSEIRFSSDDITHFLRTRNSVRRRQKHSSTFPLPAKKSRAAEEAVDGLSGVEGQNDLVENVKRAPFLGSGGMLVPLARRASLRAKVMELIGKRKQLRPRKSNALHPVRVGIGQQVADVALETFSRLLNDEENKLMSGQYQSGGSTMKGDDSMRFIG